MPASTLLLVIKLLSYPISLQTLSKLQSAVSGVDEMDAMILNRGSLAG